jgi:hypothetical protein
MSVNSEEGTVPVDDIQKVDSPRSFDNSSSIGESIESIVEDYSEPLLDWTQGNAIVTLNSILYANNDLSQENCFSVHQIEKEETGEEEEELSPIVPIEKTLTDLESNKMIGSNGDDEGFVSEETFTQKFQAFGYSVKRSSLEEMMSVRDTGDSFLLQGIAQRKSIDGCTKALYSKGGIQYLQGEEKCEAESDNLWLHCVHVLPILDCFYCSQQREFSGEMKGDIVVSSFSWLCLNGKGTVKQKGYMKKVTDVWRVSKGEGSLLNKVKRKYCQDYEVAVKLM